MTPAQQLRKVREVVKRYRQEGVSAIYAMQAVEQVVSAPEGEAAGAGEAVGYVNLEAVRNLKDDSSSCGIVHRPTAYRSTPLYTAAPKASAQALTEDEAIGLVRIASTDNMYMFGNFIGAEFSRAAALALVRSVEAFHGIPAPARMNDEEGAA